MSLQRIGSALTIALFLATPVLASAQSADTQSRISALMAQITELKARIAARQTQNGTTPTPLPPPAAGSCVNLTRNMHVGTSDKTVDGQVTQLQNYLIQNGFMTGAASGYFGFITAAAVGKLQISLGISSSITDPNYGFVGPRTRGAIACSGNSGLTASPASGRSPLTVTFTGNVVLNAEVDFGDGSSPFLLQCPGALSDMCPLTQTFTTTHTYNAPGTYRAVVTIPAAASDGQTPPPGSIYGIATVVVTSGDSQGPSAIIDPRSLTTTSVTPTINGTAKNTLNNMIGVSVLNAAGGEAYANDQIPVVNGTWSFTINTPLAPGSYSITMMNPSQGDMPTKLLATGTLVIRAPGAAPTASLTANNSHEISVNVGDQIHYIWGSTNGATAASSFVVDTPDTCNQGSGPFTWVASTLSGTSDATAYDCQGQRTYTITYTVTDASGRTASDKVVVHVLGISNQKPVTITADPLTVPSGGRSTVSWSSPDGSSCVYASPTSSPTDAPYGTYGATGATGVGPITKNATYTITCNGISKNVTVFVQQGGVTISANPDNIPSGGRTTVSWSAPEGSSCVYSSPTNSPTDAPFGTYGATGATGVGPLTVFSTYTVTCNGQSASANVSVYAGPITMH